MNEVDSRILVRRPALLIVVALGVLVSSSWVSIHLVLGLLPIVAALGVYTVARRVSADPFLWKVALLNLTMTVAISVMLFFLSQSQLPWLSELILREGFWKFAADGSYYDLNGREIARSLHHGVPFHFENASYGGGYIILVGLLYFLFGVHPLIGSFFNATLGAMTVVVVYGCAAKVLPGSSRIAALLAALWPSSLLWASQLLKETVSIFTMFGVLFLCLWLVGQEKERRSWVQWVAGSLALLVATFILHDIRPSFAVALWVAVITTGAFLLATWQTRGHQIARYVTVVAMLAAAVFSSRYLGMDFLVVLLSPNPPSVKFLRMGQEHARAGRWQFAVSEYRKAIALKPDFWPAYYDLGLALIRLGDLPGAREAFAKFVNLNDNADRAKEIERILSETKEVLPAPEALPPVASSGPALPSQFFQKKLDNLPALTGDVAAILSPKRLLVFRRGFITTGGDSLRTTDQLEGGDIWSIVKTIPSGMTAVMFSPYPWEWSHKSGAKVLLRVLAGMESLVLFALFPVVARGAWTVVRTRNPAGIQILAFSLVLMVVFGITVTNTGTLFRLRLGVVVPLLIVAAVGLSSFDSTRMRAWEWHPSDLLQ